MGETSLGDEGDGAVRWDDVVLEVDAPRWLARPLVAPMEHVRRLTPGAPLPRGGVGFDIRYLGDQGEADAPREVLLFVEPVDVTWNRSSGPAPAVRDDTARAWPRPQEWPSKIDGVVIDLPDGDTSLADAVPVATGDPRGSHRPWRARHEQLGRLQHVAVRLFWASLVVLGVAVLADQLGLLDPTVTGLIIVPSGIVMFASRLVWRYSERAARR